MDEKRSIRTRVSAGSGNVFADLGFAQPEGELTKAQLASDIRQIIKRQRLTRTAVAARTDIDELEVSALLDSRLKNFSSEDLMRLSRRLRRGSARSTRNTKCG